MLIESSSTEMLSEVYPRRLSKGEISAGHLSLMDRCNPNNVTDSDEQVAMMVRYLLGQSPDEELAQVEERFFSDRTYCDQLLALEDSLIDDFLRDRMPIEQLNAFNETLSLRQDDVLFSRALAQAVIKKKPERRAPGSRRPVSPSQRMRLALRASFMFAVAIAPLILLVVALALLLRNQSLKNMLSETGAQLARLKEEKETAERELIQARSQTEYLSREMQIERNKGTDAKSLLQKESQTQSARRSSEVERILLSSVFINRGAGSAIETVRVFENVRWLQFVIPVKDYDRYELFGIAINPAGRKVIIEKRSLTPIAGSPNLDVLINATDLQSGDYVLTLYGERPDGPRTQAEQYAFRIVFQ